MNLEPSAKIDVITRTDESESRSDKVKLMSQTLDVADLRERFQKFMLGLQSIIDVAESGASAFHLTEIEFSAEITGSGDFKLLGTGVGVEATSAIKFVLHRRVPQ